MDELLRDYNLLIFKQDTEYRVRVFNEEGDDLLSFIGENLEELLHLVSRELLDLMEYKANNKVYTILYHTFDSDGLEIVNTICSLTDKSTAEELKVKLNSSIPKSKVDDYYTVEENLFNPNYSYIYEDKDLFIESLTREFSSIEILEYKPLFKQVIGIIKQGDKDIHIEIRRAIEEDYKNLYTGIIWDNNIGVHGVHNFLYKDLDSLYKDIHKFLVNDLLSK